MSKFDYSRGAEYSATVHGGFLLQGNNHGTINASILQLNNQTVDIASLIDNLKNATQQYNDLRSLLLDRPSPVTAAKDLSRDVDELQGLVETLQSYLSEHKMTDSQGLQEPWLELNNMAVSCQTIVERTQDLVKLSQESVEDDIVNAMAMRAEARRLRTKLNIAIGVIAFCSCSDARDPYIQELRFLYERLRDLQEEVENERALNLPRTNPLTLARIGHLSEHDSLIMRRFMAHSLTSDRATLRESSIRVSTLICEEDLPVIKPEEDGTLRILDVDPTEQPPPELFVRALYDYQTDDFNELNFRRGECIRVLGKLESGWWDGLLDGRRGWFPSNYCTSPATEDVILAQSSNGLSANQSLDHLDGTHRPYRDSMYLESMRILRQRAASNVTSSGYAM